MSTPDVAAAQLRKAIKIERALRLAGCHNADLARSLDASGRRNAETAAGVRISSETTWALVHVLLDCPRITVDQIAAQARAMDDLASAYDDGNSMLVGPR